jgi:UDP-glucuronate decarboxylase
MDTSADFTGPVNVGNPIEFTMLEFAELVLRLTASNSKLVLKPLPEDDPRQRKPDIELAKGKLGWKPTVTLEDGLKETIALFKKTITNKG